MLLDTCTDQKEFHFKKGDSTTPEEFHKLFKELFSRTWVVKGKEYHLPSLGWEMGYHNRKRSLGTCQYRFNRITHSLTAGQVLISKVLLNKNLDKAYDFEDTIRHEIAHAIDAQIRLKSNHDGHWKMVCREIGADDTRLHEGFLEKPKGKYTLKCDNCGHTTEKYRMIKTNKACGICCNKHANGRYDARFKLRLIQNY